MQTSRKNTLFSFSLAALITFSVLAGIDYQAQPQAAEQQLAQVAAPKA